MRVRNKQWLLYGIAIALACSPLAAVAAQAKAPAPIAVVSIAGADKLLGDVAYLAEAAGAGDFGRLIALMASPFTAGLDKGKPIGIYATMEDGAPAGVLFLPVKDLKLLLAALEAQVGQPKELGDGLLEIASDKPQPMFIKQQGGWAFASNRKEQLASLPQNPAQLLAGMDANYTLAVRVNVQNIPAPFREMAVEGMRRGFEEGMQRNLNDKQREVARKLGQSWVKAIEQLIQDVEAVTLGWQVDAKGHTTHLDVQVTATAGTELAKQMATTKKAKSAFAGFVSPDNAMSLHVTSQSSPEDIEQAVMLLGLAREEALKGIDKDANMSADDRQTRARSSANCWTWPRKR